MKVEIEVENKYVNAVVAQLAIDDDYNENDLEKIKEKCFSETVKIDTNKLGEDSKELQLAIAMITVGLVGDEIKN